MTTLQLSILMAAYTGVANFTAHFPDTPTYRTQKNRLREWGLIDYENNNDIHYAMLTEKGRFWYDHVLNTPMPIEVKKYEIPGSDNVKSS